MTYMDLISEFGKPLFEIELSHYTDEQRLLSDIPEKVAVFARPQTAERIIVWGKVREEHWLPNYGHRALIRELMKKCEVI